MELKDIDIVGVQCFYAIGFYKTVLQSAEINSGVLAGFNIGEAAKLDNVDALAKQPESSVNGFDDKLEFHRD